MWLSRLRTQQSVCEDVGSIPGLTQGVKDLTAVNTAWIHCCHGSGIGRQRGSNSVPSLGTSIGHRCSCKKENNKKEKHSCTQSETLGVAPSNGRLNGILTQGRWAEDFKESLADVLALDKAACGPDCHPEHAQPSVALGPQALTMTPGFLECISRSSRAQNHSFPETRKLRLSRRPKRYSTSRIASSPLPSDHPGWKAIALFPSRKQATL